MVWPESEPEVSGGSLFCWESDCPRGNLYRRTLQKASCLLLPGQQRADFALQRFVARGGVPQKRVALLGRALPHSLQQAIDLFPLFRVHRLVPPVSSR